MSTANSEPSDGRRFEADPRAKKRRGSAAFYNEDSVRKRRELQSHPEIVALLHKLWVAANTSAADAIIDKQEYLVMHRKIVLALDPFTTPRKAQQQAEDDWVRDSDGNAGLDQSRFYWTWFELADTYTKSMEAEEYVGFLQRMIDALLGEAAPPRADSVDHEGGAAWRSDRAIIESYFDRQRRRGKGRDAETSMPLVMSTWHRHLQAERDSDRAHKEEARVRCERTKEVAPAMPCRRTSLGSSDQPG